MNAACYTLPYNISDGLSVYACDDADGDATVILDTAGDEVWLSLDEAESMALGVYHSGGYQLSAALLITVGVVRRTGDSIARLPA